MESVGQRPVKEAFQGEARAKECRYCRVVKTDFCEATLHPLGKIELHFAQCRQKFDFLQQTQCLSKLLHKRISNKYENFPAKCVNHDMLGPKINKFQHLNPIEIWEGLNVLVKFALSLLNNLSTLPKATQISLKLH